MEKEIIPYKQALELKKLGFDEPCFGYYNIKDNNLKLFSNELVDSSCNSDLKYDDFKHCTAPLYQQAFRWFREKYDINCYIDCYFSIVHKGGKYHYHTMNGGSNGFFTYEKAELACLIKLIKMVKNK